MGGVSVSHLLVVVHLSYFGGDWCWGPRYLIPVLPLWALAFPYAAGRLRRPRLLLAPLVVAGLLVQILGISLDQHRFFYERNLPDHFWATEPWFYFRDSQLIARPSEIAESISAGMPREALYFSSAPGLPTYCIFGPTYPDRSRAWARQFRMFYLPRPWWGWMGRFAPERQPVDPPWLLAICTALLALGGLLLAQSLQTCPLDIGQNCRSLRRPIGEPREAVALRGKDS